MDRYISAEALVCTLNPQRPVSCIRPEAAHHAAQYFLKNFTGHTLYAVKTNPHPYLLKVLYQSGISQFDVASLSEVALVREILPRAEINFLHPIKNRAAIERAYYDYDVRSFAFDSVAELEKISSSTDHSKDLTLLMRLSVSNRYAAHSLTGKFGATSATAVPLLKNAAKRCERLGLCFHVGSQCLDPTAYKIALQKIKKITYEANIPIDIVDVGGGFPSLYPGQQPAPLADYFSAIETTLTEISLPNNFEIWCEPGRALVAEAGSIIVHVDARKNDLLYINDGTYGGLFDAGLLGFRYPVKCLGKNGSTDLKPFIFYGPTCDSLDVMPGPFMLPSDITEGDYIEIGLTGAYSSALRTPFNGFDKLQEAILEDAPMTSMYSSTESTTPALDAGKI